MEKRRIRERRYRKSMYSDFDPPSALSRIVDCTGMYFVGGTVVGSFYHMIKSCKQQPSLVSRIKLAPRVGGYCAFLSTVNNVIAESVHSMDVSFSTKAAARLMADGIVRALIWAPKGICSASRAALAFTTISAVTRCANIWDDQPKKISKTNTTMFS